MKGIQGLLIAAAFFLIGAALNMWYLSQRASPDDTVSYVRIKTDKSVKKGELIGKDQVDMFTLPLEQAGSLKKMAFEQKSSVVNSRAVHDLAGGQVVLRDDLRTAPPELPEGKRVVGIPLDLNRVVSSFIIPGKTKVLVLLPRTQPSPALNDGGTAQPLSTGPEEVGPFEVVAIGNRLGSVETMDKSANVRSVQENVLSIHVTGENKQLVDRVLEYLARNSNRPLVVEVYSEPPSSSKE